MKKGRLAGAPFLFCGTAFSRRGDARDLPSLDPVFRQPSCAQQTGGEALREAVATVLGMAMLGSQSRSAATRDDGRSRFRHHQLGDNRPSNIFVTSARIFSALRSKKPVKE